MSDKIHSEIQGKGGSKCFQNKRGGKTTKVCNLKVCRDALIKGDLTVEGCIHNPQLDLLLNSVVPSSDEVYTQYEQYDIINSGAKFLSYVEELQVDPFAIVPGTEPTVGSMVYGYNDDQTLDLNGGVAKSYTADFTAFPLQYNTSMKLDEIEMWTPDAVTAGFQRALSFYVQRGFQLQTSDIPEQFEGQYLYLPSDGQWQFFNGRPYIGLKFVYGDEDPSTPIAVDLIATASPWFFVLDVFEADQSQYQNGHGYPIRIPITQDFCCVYLKKFETEPIAYYDSVHRRITIHVPNTGTEYLLGSTLLEISSQPQSNVDYRDNLLGFDGTFSLLKRDSQNQLVAANFATATILVQATPTVSVQSRLYTFGVPEDFALEIPFYTSGEFTGALVPLINGGTESFNWFTIPASLPQLGGFVSAGGSTIDPLQYPAQGIYPEGDNPMSKLVEKYSCPSYLEGLDSDLWFEFQKGLPNNVLTGQTYPEFVSTTAPLELLTQDRIAELMGAHEFGHNLINGAFAIFPLEGFATAMEMDAKASNNALIPDRAADWTFLVARVTRGTRTMMQPNYTTNTFGLSLFWFWLSTQFDTNHQVQRRVADILVAETAGPLFQANNFPTMFVDAIPNNPTGGSFALQQALNELYSKDIRDIWTDFNISACFLRNNTSIPPEYQHKFPYWIWNSDYADYTGLQNAMLNPFGLGDDSAFANFWEVLDENGVLPPSWGTPYTGETFIQTLPSEFSADVPDLRNFSFAIPLGTTSVSVTILSGEWRLTVAQFVSDGTSVGSWSQDGPYSVDTVFDVTGYDPSVKLCLICTHVTLTDLGGLANYFGPLPNTGSISITRDGPVLVTQSLPISLESTEKETRMSKSSRCRFSRRSLDFK